MFSVVIPVYKNYKELLKSVESCQSPLVSEVIIVDDTPSFLKQDISIGLDGIPIKIINNNKNRGVTFSRNRGFFASSQEFIIFLDSDDILVSKNLHKAKKYITENFLDGAFFCTTTDKINNSKQRRSVEGNWHKLFKMANTGERLVIIKKTQCKPFFGALRGHELAGIFRLSERKNFKLGWSPLVMREYLLNNTQSLSQLRLTKERSILISRGHLNIACRLLSLCYYKISIVYFFKAFYYGFIVRFLAGSTRHR